MVKLYSARGQYWHTARLANHFSRREFVLAKATKSKVSVAHHERSKWPSRGEAPELGAADESFCGERCHCQGSTSGRAARRARRRLSQAVIFHASAHASCQPHQHSG